MFINSFVTTALQKDIGVPGSNTESEYPVYGFYDYGFFGYMYRQSEIKIANKCWITGLRFNMRGDSNIPKTLNNQTITLFQCNLDEFPTNMRNTMAQSPDAGSYNISNEVSVKSNFTWSIPALFDDWIQIDFNIPYSYDPTTDDTNLILRWKNRDGSYNSGSATPDCRAFPSDDDFLYYRDYADGSLPSLNDAGTRENISRPCIQLIFER